MAGSPSRRAPATHRVAVERALTLSLEELVYGSGRYNGLPLAQAAAVGFLETLRPGDEASVTEFNDAVTLLPESTSDRAALRRAVGRISAGGTTALYSTLYVTLKDLPSPARTRRDNRPDLTLRPVPFPLTVGPG